MQPGKRIGRPPKRPLASTPSSSQKQKRGSKSVSATQRLSVVRVLLGGDVIAEHRNVSVRAKEEEHSEAEVTAPPARKPRKRETGGAKRKRPTKAAPSAAVDDEEEEGENDDEPLAQTAGRSLQTDEPVSSDVDTELDEPASKKRKNVAKQSKSPAPSPYNRSRVTKPTAPREVEPEDEVGTEPEAVESPHESEPIAVEPKTNDAQPAAEEEQEAASGAFASSADMEVPQSKAQPDTSLASTSELGSE